MAADSRVLLAATTMSDEELEEDEECDWKEVQTHCDLSPSRVNTPGIGLGVTVSPYLDSSKGMNNDGTNTVLAPKSKPRERIDPVQHTDQNGPSRMSLNDHKAGMEGLDKEKINKIIYEASKGSKFYENELKKEKQLNERIKRQNDHLESCTEQEKVEAMIEADRIVSELEHGRDLSRTIVHIDMDAFYAAVEMRDNPSLKDKPMAVGSMGMLSTSNYPARRYGIRAAMPGFIAKKLCPQLVIVPLHFDKYREVSQIVRGIFTQYDPNFMPMSLDEAYLDLTDYLQERQKSTEKRVFHKNQTQNSNTMQNSGGVTTNSEQVQVEIENQSTKKSAIDLENNQTLEAVEFGNTVEDIVREIRFRIENETSLTASAGIACNSMLAKVCTDRNKPNGQFYLKPDREEVLELVRNLPIRKISGIGRVSEQMLKALGITTCADLYDKRDLLVLLSSDISARFSIEVALGLGATRLEGDRERKSLSTERTFSEISAPAQLLSECEKLCQTVGQDMLQEDLKPRTVTLKLKTVKFEVKSRSTSFAHAISSVEEILTSAKDLLSKEIKACEPKPLRLRLMGVRLSNFQNCSTKSTKQDTITTFFSKGNNGISPKKRVVESQSQAGPSASCSRYNEDFLSEPNWLPAHTKSPGVSEHSMNETVLDSSCILEGNISADGSTCGQEVKESGTDFTAICPVCDKSQKAAGPDFLAEFNRHIDMCLNRVAIREALSEDQQAQGHVLHAKGKSTQASPTKGGKGGKRKQQTTKDSSQTKKRTLETFWSK